MLLVGGGPAGAAGLRLLARIAPCVVAADGGARAALAAGLLPEAVIGDLDSLDAASRAAIAPERIHLVAEQDSTDFDKALRSISAPVVLGAGFLGARRDHELACLNALVRHADRPCVLVGRSEVILHLPPVLDLPLGAGDAVSLFPLRAVTGRSRGLHWPIDGLAFAPDGRIGTSNRATGPVHLAMDGPGMLAILPRRVLRPLVAALGRAARWPAL